MIKWFSWFDSTTASVLVLHRSYLDDVNPSKADSKIIFLGSIASPEDDAGDLGFD